MFHFFGVLCKFVWWFGYFATLGLRLLILDWTSVKENPVMFGPESDSYICQGHPCCGYAVSRRASNSQEVILVLFSFCFLWKWLGFMLKNSQPFMMRLMVFPHNDIWEKSTEIPYWWHIITQIWVVLLIGWKFASSNPKPYPDLGSNVSSVGNLCACFPDIILQGNQSCHHKISAVFSG